MDSVLHFHIPLTWNFPICLDMGYKSLYIIAQTPHKCKRFLKFFLGNFHKNTGVFVSSLWLCGENFTKRFHSRGLQTSTQSA
jgi:hypothetical protein